MPTSSCSATATFIYCLIVDGTVRENLEFVPQLSTAAGILLGVDIAVLIFFIHHVATSVRVESVIANITDDLRDVIEKLFPPNSASARPIRTKSNALDPKSGSAPGFVVRSRHGLRLG